MYLSIKQHDTLRNLVMGFEVPYSLYIAERIVNQYPLFDDFASAMRVAKDNLPTTVSLAVKNGMTSLCKDKDLREQYGIFHQQSSNRSVIVSEDTDNSTVGKMCTVTCGMMNSFSQLYLLFVSYEEFCLYSEKYRYVRNKLNHARTRTLEDDHMLPVLVFIRKICDFLDDKYFVEKKREELLQAINSLQKNKVEIPIKKHNLEEIPSIESRIVCRSEEISMLKNFVYGNSDDIRKQHSICIYGYGGVGKTALVIEVVKQIVQDVLDGYTENDYCPQYVYFFTAKKRRLTLANETGKIIEQQTRNNFETAEELISLINESFENVNFKKYHEEGIIIIDNLETLSEEERQEVKTFIEKKTPAEMQFIITSRHSEEYEKNYKLGGFEAETGKKFVDTYAEENDLDISLTEREKNDLISIAKGNTLVLVLCIRRLSSNLLAVHNLRSDFKGENAWKNIRRGIEVIPPNAYEVVSEFMFKDTFEQIESIMSPDISLFYKILKVFAVIQNEEIDISTVVLLVDDEYYKVETIIDLLCNYLIVERKNGYLSLNGFAEKYIISRFMPDSIAYQKMFSEISGRRRKIKDALERLKIDKCERPELASILRDWAIVNDSDLYLSAKMYSLYGRTEQACRDSSRYWIESALDDLITECNEAERITAHPYIKYQKARILQIIDDSRVLDQIHVEEIKKSYEEAIYVINMVGQYSSIQQTKSYASMLWIYGQYLYFQHDIEAAIKYLETSEKSFESQGIDDEQYYQCCTLLATCYLDYYVEKKEDRLLYLRQARKIDNTLQAVYRRERYVLGKATKHAMSLHDRLSRFGQY